MNKKFSKTKIIPTIIGTAFLFVLFSCFAAAVILNVTTSSFAQESRYFSEEVEKVSQLVQQQVQQKIKMLESYKTAIELQPEKSKQGVLQMLGSLNCSNEFLGVGIIFENGEQYMSNGYTFSEKATAELLSKIKNQSQVIYAADGNVTCQAVPIVLNGENAVLVGTISARFENIIIANDEQQLQLYVLDEQNNVVVHFGHEGKRFDYTKLEKTRIYKPNDMLLDMLREENPRNLQSLNPREIDEIDGGMFVYSLSEIASVMMVIKDQNQTMWFEHSFSPVEGTQWNIVVGKSAELSLGAESFVYTTCFLVGILLVVFFLLMVSIIITQGLTQHKLSCAAYMDTVTKSYNWHKFCLEVERVLRRNRNTSFAMVSFDIRKFRVISDMDGYYNSDIILQKMSAVLSKAVRKKEFFTRYASDEYTMFLRYNTKQELEDRVLSIDKTLKEKLNVKNISFAYGVFYIEDYNMPVARIYNYACLAKDEVKKNNHNVLGVFSSKLRDVMMREKEIENNMDKGLENSEFAVYLQPKYSTDGKTVAGAEALVRWISPEMGFVSPGEFIPLFETNGFILKLDNYMLDKVCVCQKKWQDEGKQLVTISVNISRKHMQDPDLANSISSIVDKYNIPYSCIELELTESAFFDDKLAILQNINNLQEKGFLISMDDFGSGYSSLNSLKDLPLDIVKLDCEFFNKSDNQKRSETVITDTIRMAKHLNMKIVAEGIETKEQVDFLSKIGCDSIQGYYFAKPMPVADFETLMGYISPKKEI